MGEGEPDVYPCYAHASWRCAAQHPAVRPAGIKPGRVQCTASRQAMPANNPKVSCGAKGPYCVLADAGAEVVNHLGHYGQGRNRSALLPTTAPAGPQGVEHSQAQHLPELVVLAAMPRARPRGSLGRRA